MMINLPKSVRKGKGPAEIQVARLEAASAACEEEALRLDTYADLGEPKLIYVRMQAYFLASLRGRRVASFLETKDVQGFIQFVSDEVERYNELWNTLAKTNDRIAVNGFRTFMKAKIAKLPEECKSFKAAGEAL
jgi:hypothetical protein